MRSIPFSPFHERPKASEWRWLEYSEPIPIIGKDASRLHAAIKTRLPPKQWVLADAYGNETRRVGLDHGRGSKASHFGASKPVAKAAWERVQGL